MRRCILISLLLAALPCTAQSAVSWSPEKLVNGSPVLFLLPRHADLRSLSGTWLDHHLVFSWDATSKSWYAIAGCELSTPAGSYILHVKGASRKGKPFTLDQPIAVGHKTYPDTVITVEKKYTEPNPDELKQIAEEKSIKKKAFADTTADRLWSGHFDAPVTAARISDTFGTTRTFNGIVQSTHEGLDYAVPSGTAVHALNRGRIVLAQSLYFEGGFIVIDHGQGLMTLYLHLSHLDVKAGDEVVRGQQIASSGGTGRATGPHLHVAVRWQGTYLDPATFLDLQLP